MEHHMEIAIGRTNKKVNATHWMQVLRILISKT